MIMTITTTVIIPPNTPPAIAPVLLPPLSPVLDDGGDDDTVVATFVTAACNVIVVVISVTVAFDDNEVTDGDKDSDASICSSIDNDVNEDACVALITHYLFILKCCDSRHGYLSITKKGS